MGQTRYLNKLVIHGNVQGVGFRWFVRDAADRLGIKGLVRNMPNGTVEIVCDCDSELLEQFMDELENNSTSGQVTNIVMDKVMTDKKFDRFEIEI